MKKLCAIILFAMVLIGVGLALSASQVKADCGHSYYYVDSFGFQYYYGRSPYYTQRPGYWNRYNRGYNQGYWNGYYNSYRPYTYQPQPYYRPYYYNYYYYPRPYYYAPRPYYRRPCWP